MKDADLHLSDEQLLLDVEGELPPEDEKLVRVHLDACWTCRARRQELANAIVDFVRVHQRQFEPELPSAAGPRALLKAQLGQLASSEPGRAPRYGMLKRFAGAGAVGILLLLGLFLGHPGIQRPKQSRTRILSIPDSRLTPGATLLLSRPAVCAQASSKNRLVPRAIQKQVFEEYGIAGADPQAYEVDYLVTPALGGADDIHNLWPHSYSATIWNAQVKDDLEDRMREMVCDGRLDLTEAQQQIAANWIEAYKKYFHTNQPVGRRMKEQE